MIEEIRKAVERLREQHPHWTGSIARTPGAQPLMANLYSPSLCTGDQEDATWWLQLRDHDSGQLVEGEYAEQDNNTSGLLAFFQGLESKLTNKIAEADRILAMRPEELAS